MTSELSRRNVLTPTSVDEAIRLAELMARGGLIPDHLKDNPANCLLIVEQSLRWGMSSFAVAQCTSVIRGRLMFEGKLVAAVVNALGDLEASLDYEYSGAGPSRECRVFGKKRGETKERSVSVVFRDVSTSQDCWKKQPDQQLAYAGSRVWARRHSPELMLGVYSPEEFVDAQEAVILPPSRDAEKVALSVSSAPRATMLLDAHPLESAPPQAPPPSPVPVPLKPKQSPKPRTALPEKRLTIVLPDGSTSRANVSAAAEETSDGHLPDDFTEEELATLQPAVTAAIPIKMILPGEVQCWIWSEATDRWFPGKVEPRRTEEQNRKLHVLKSSLGITDEVWTNRSMEKFNKSSSADFSVGEASEVIDALEKAATKVARDKRTDEVIK